MLLLLLCVCVVVVAAFGKKKKKKRQGKDASMLVMCNQQAAELDKTNLYIYI